MSSEYDVIVIGAGAAGMMCAAEAGMRGRTVWLIDHAKKIGEKIRISGGGRCNFTNSHTSPHNFLSGNPHFCKSALKQFTQDDFVKMVQAAGISYHEKKFGQLFCDEKSQQIIDMMLAQCSEANVRLSPETEVEIVEKTDEGYEITTSRGLASARSLVIATGGLSIPKIGATKFGYDIARQFGLNVKKTFPALVPFTFQTEILERCKALSGIAIDATVQVNGTSFREGLLFTHRGLSGPSILQISSYWNEGDAIEVNMCPDINVFDYLKERRQTNPKQGIQTAIAHILPKHLAELICTDAELAGNLADISDKKFEIIADSINRWSIKPAGTEGYRTAEVTIGGVDTNELSSKTMECNNHNGLYFIGEVVDVTGHLGGFNFQWAWSSGYVAGQYA